MVPLAIGINVGYAPIVRAIRQLFTVADVETACRVAGKCGCPLQMNNSPALGVCVCVGGGGGITPDIVNSHTLQG